MDRVMNWITNDQGLKADQLFERIYSLKMMASSPGHTIRILAIRVIRVQYFRLDKEITFIKQ
jgi:hypothetical protein